MPSVRMLTASAGPKGNRAKGYGYPVSAEEGAELVAGGFAVWIEAPKLEQRVTIETATAEPAEVVRAVEQAVTRVGRRKRS